MATTWPRPELAWARTRRRCSTSASRPTKRVRPRSAAACRRVRAVPGPRQFEDLDRLREALHGDGSERPHLDVALGEPHGLCGQPDGPGQRQLFHPGREVSRLAHGRVVHAEIAADRADDDLARVEADPDLHLHPVRAPRVVRVALQRLLHPQRGVARPHGVILVGERRAEERHDPVAHHLVDGALVAVDRLHHPLEHGVEELARLLRVAVGQQLHRALEVGEEHGDLLALAFEGGLGGEDLLGEVLRGVARQGRLNLPWRSSGCRQRSSDVARRMPSTELVALGSLAKPA